MANVWPTELNGMILDGSYNETPPENSIRTKMDVGPAKVRRRSTSGIRPVSFSLFLTNANVVILDDFYDSTLSSGSETFTFYAPRTKASGTYRFVTRPTYAPKDQGYIAKISLEKMP